MKKSTTIVFYILILLFCQKAFNQNRKIDSLELSLNTEQNDTSKIKTILNISEFFLDENPIKAQQYAQEAVDLAKKIKNDKLIGEALAQLSICYDYNYEYDKGVDAANESYLIFQKLNDYVGMSKALNSKGYVLIDKGDFLKAIEFYTQSIEYASKAQYNSGLSSAYNNLGCIYDNVDNVNKSFEYYRKALKIDSLTNNANGVAKAYNNLGKLYAKQGNYEKCIFYYLKSYEIFAQTNNKKENASLLLNIGNVYVETKNYAKALENYKKSIELKKQFSDKSGIANTYNNIGALYLKQKIFDSTINYFTKAEQIYTETGNQRGIARIYGNLGIVYEEMKQYNKAKELLNKSIKMRLALNDYNGAGEAYNSLGKLCFIQKNWNAAIKNYELSLEYGIKTTDKKLQSLSYEKLSSCYAKLNNYAMAYMCYQKHHLLNDSVLNEQKQKQIIELQTKYETSNKDREITFLSKEKEMNKLQIEQKQYQIRIQQFIILLVILLVILAGVFTIIYYRLNKQKTLVNLLLQTKNNEIENQRNSLEQLNIELENQKKQIARQRDEVAEELKETLLKSEIIQRQNLQFKFETLKNQLNPHFLFNTYSTLISLIPENAQLAETYTRHLSSVYRYILMSKDKELIRLAEELNFISSYMFLIAIRFDNNVVLQININDKTKELFIPLLSLQLLVENAVKHNIASPKKPLTITIENINSTLIIRNNLQQKSSVENSTQIGLQNIIKRYELLTTQQVEIAQTETEFIVKLPLITENIINY